MNIKYIINSQISLFLSVPTVIPLVQDFIPETFIWSIFPVASSTHCLSSQSNLPVFLQLVSPNTAIIIQWPNYVSEPFSCFTGCLKGGSRTCTMYPVLSLSDAQDCMDISTRWSSIPGCTEPLPLKCRGGGNAFLHGSLGGALNNSVSAASEHCKCRASSLVLPFLPGEVAQQDWELTAWPLCSSETEWSAKWDKTTVTTVGREQRAFVQWAQILSSSLKVTGERGRKEGKKAGREGGGREGGEVQLCPHAKVYLPKLNLTLLFMSSCNREFSSICFVPSTKLNRQEHRPLGV